MGMKRGRERDLLTACRQLLAIGGAFVVRVNSGAVRATSRAGRKRYVRFNSEPGCSDLLACWRGRFVAVEVKLPGRKLTPAQRSFLAAVEAAGGVALVVHDIRDLERALGGLA